MPNRIQLRRTHGWRKPAGTIVVARPTRWGNPFRIDDLADLIEHYEISHNGDAPPRGALRGQAQRMAVSWFADMVTTRIPRQVWPKAAHHYPSTDEIIAALTGHDLACWCPLDQPCHADVLLELANS